MPVIRAALIVAVASLATDTARPTVALQAQPSSASRSTNGSGLQRLLPGHYVYVHTDETPGVSPTFNSGLIVTVEGVVVVDALGSEAIARRVRAAVDGVTSQPVRFLISSTFHGPFTGGNVAYHDAFRIGHENYRLDLMRLLEKEPPTEQSLKLPQTDVS